MSARTQTEVASLVRLKNTDQLYSLKIAKGFYNDESETIMTRFAG